MKNIRQFDWWCLILFYIDIGKEPQHRRLFYMSSHTAPHHARSGFSTKKKCHGVLALTIIAAGLVEFQYQFFFLLPFLDRRYDSRVGKAFVAVFPLMLYDPATVVFLDSHHVLAIRKGIALTCFGFFGDHFAVFEKHNPGFTVGGADKYIVTGFLP